MKIKGFYNFRTKTNLSKMILISDSENWNRRNVFNNYNPFFSLDFLLKRWFFDGYKVNHSTQPTKHIYKDVIVTEVKNSRPAIVLGLSNKNAIVVQTWTGVDSMKMSAILIDINGAIVSGNGTYTLFDNPQYPVAGGRINNEKAFLLDSLHGRILSVINGELKVQNKNLDTPLINTQDSSYSVYLSASNILLFKLNFELVGIDIQLIKIDENDEFVIIPSQHFATPNRLGDIRVAKISDNQCFISYIKKLSNSGWNFTIEGMVVSVLGTTILMGEPVTLLNYQTTDNPPLTDVYSISDPFYLTTIPNQNTVIAWYLQHKVKHDYFANPVAPVTAIKAQLINISGSSVTTQPLVEIEQVTFDSGGFDEIFQPGFIPFYIVFEIGVIPVSTSEFVLLINHNSFYEKNNLPRYMILSIDNGNLVKKKKEIIANSYDLSGSFTKDYDFLTLAMGINEANGQFGNYTIIPPLY